MVCEGHTGYMGIVGKLPPFGVILYKVERIGFFDVLWRTCIEREDCWISFITRKLEIVFWSGLSRKTPEYLQCEQISYAEPVIL